MIQVAEKLDASIEAAIRAYLTGLPPGSGACGEHDPRWLAVLRQALGHRPYALIAHRGEHADSPICGYLPLALVRSPLFGRHLISLPYLNRAGVVADDPATARDLIAQAVVLSDRLGVKYLELRHQSPIEHASLPDKREEKVRMVMELPATSGGGEILMKGYDAKVRNLVRKGDKSELTIRWGGAEVLDAFYDVFAVNMRDLGTPVYGKKLFGSILQHFPDNAELAVVDHKGQPIAGALLVHDPVVSGTTAVPSASSLREFNSTNANMWMYHQLLLRAISRGSKEFDFGRSSVDSGTYRFKKQWGAAPRPTVWQYHIRSGDMNAMRPDNPRHQRLIERWQKLPVWLTRIVGPPIVRGIPA